MLNVGVIVGERYEIAGRVGSGGMADVYKAKDHKLNRFVAMKVLKPEFSADTNFIKKFQREAQAAAGLAHPNIVNGPGDQLYCYGTGGRYYFKRIHLQKRQTDRKRGNQYCDPGGNGTGSCSQQKYCAQGY